LTNGKAAVWTVDDVALLIEIFLERFLIYLFIFTLGSI